MKPAPAAPPAAAASPAKAAKSPATAAATGPDPIANEKIVWDLIKGRNYDAFAALLAPDFLEIEPDGYYDKAGSVKAIAMFDPSKFESSDFKAVKFDANTALVTYLTKEPTLAPHGERNSSIWVNRDGKWLAILHHGGTAVAPPEADAAKPAASPSAYQVVSI